MNPLDLIHIQLELECIGADASNVLFRIPGDNPDDVARCYAAHHTTGYVTFVRGDVGPSIANAVRALSPQQVFEDIETVKRILGGETASQVQVSAFRAYCFQKLPAPDEYADVVGEGDRFAIRVGGELVSWAQSSRSNSRASELATETKPDYRRRGYARQVCAAWARHQLEQGKIAFYSHRSENIASQALASSLGVLHFVDGVNYE